jgi:hypothetical protein
MELPTPKDPSILSAVPLPTAPVVRETANQTVMIESQLVRATGHADSG